MAKATATAADLAAAGQQPAPTVETTALCDLGQCARCPGEIVSLLVEPGTPCSCGCHGAVEVAGRRL
jgi:hypothetical protein